MRLKGGDSSMIDSAIETVLGQTWLQGRLRYNYLSPDKAAAETVGYHENGQMRFCYPVQNEKIHGIGRIWYENGDLQSEESYEHNSLHGPKKEWHPNGQLKKEANYKNGMLDGVRKEWYDTGILLKQCFYKEDRLDGQYLEMYGNGHIRQDFNFVTGRRHGLFNHGKPDGTIKLKEAYVRNVKIPLNIYKLFDTKQLTAKDILGIQNAEIRRICLEELGYARFLAQVDHQVIEKEGEYELVRINWYRDEEPICLVKVKCPSTGAFYTLRVPPDVQTIKEAVAWTFGLKANEYVPEKET